MKKFKSAEELGAEGDRLSRASKTILDFAAEALRGDSDLGVTIIVADLSKGDHTEAIMSSNIEAESNLIILGNLLAFLQEKNEPPPLN